MSRLGGKKMQCFRNGTTGGTFITKEAIAGTIGSGGDSPQFPVEVANRYYSEKYQVPVRLQHGPLSWFPYLLEEKFGHAFDMSPLPLVLSGRSLVKKRPPQRQVPMSVCMGFYRGCLRHILFWPLCIPVCSWRILILLLSGVKVRLS
jgi:hypothetical protein